MSLESIVRPFQRNDTFRTRRIVAHAEKVEVKPATISWGAAGTLAKAEEVEDLGLAFRVITCDDRFQEQKRKEKQERITQKLDDGTEVTENFVDVKRPTEIEFDKKSEHEVQNYDKKTQSWVEVPSSTFSTVDNSKKKCKATYEFTAPAT